MQCQCKMQTFYLYLLNNIVCLSVDLIIHLYVGVLVVVLIGLLMYWGVHALLSKLVFFEGGGTCMCIASLVVLLVVHCCSFVGS